MPLVRISQIEGLQDALDQIVNDNTQAIADAKAQAVAGAAAVTQHTIPSGDIDGTQTTFALPSEPDGQSLQVFLRGVTQAPSEYAYATSNGVQNGNFIVFNDAPLAGDTVVVRYRPLA